MTKKAGCPHRWKMLPGFTTRYICEYCEVEGEPDTRADKESVPQLPRERLGWIHRVLNRMREWKREAAEQGKGTSGDGASVTPTFAVSTTLLPPAPTYDDDDRGD